MATFNPRGVKKLSRTARNVNLVVCAMRNLDDENGSTVGNIVGYLTNNYERAPKREVIAALKRSMEFGIVDRKRGRYFLGENEECFGHISGLDNSDAADSNKNDTDQPNSNNTGHYNNRRRGLGNNNGSTELLERDIRSRKVKKIKRPRKTKDASRRKKSIKKSPRGKSIRKTRFAHSLKPYDLADFYRNQNYKTSRVSSINSLECYELEG